MITIEIIKVLGEPEIRYNIRVSHKNGSSSQFPVSNTSAEHMIRAFKMKIMKKTPLEEQLSPNTEIYYE